MARSARKKKSSSLRKKQQKFQFLRFFLSIFIAFSKMLVRPFAKTRHLKKGRVDYRPHWKRGSVLVAVCILSIFLFISFWSGYVQRILNVGETSLIDLTAKLGFKIEEVFIEGRHYISPEVLSNTIQAYRGQPILNQNLEDLKEKLSQINWVKEVHIQRRLPHHLYIKIVERYPIARWQHQKKLFLVDNEGIVIQNVNCAPFQNLPLVVGTDAPIYAPKILKLLDKFPLIRERLSALTRIHQRRWDLLLNQSIQVKLSEENLEEGLARLSLLVEQGKISPSEVFVVDLRNPKQLVLRLTPEAAVRIKLKGKET